MRRADHRMPAGECDALLRRAHVLRLGLVDGGEPYVVPVNFGYEPGRIYVHGPLEGRRIAAVGAGARVCFEVDEGEVVPAGTPCAWSSRFASVIGYGHARMLDDPADKRRGLDAIMRHFGSSAEGIPEGKLGITSVMEIAIESVEGKWHRRVSDGGGAEDV